MKPVKFEGYNIIIAKDQPQYLPLPAYAARDTTGTVVCCWQLSWRERFKLLFTGKLWHQILTFNKPLQPQHLNVMPPPMLQPDALEDFG